MERLSSDYIKGYTKAIQDVSEIFEYIEDDLKHHKMRLNAKTAKALLSSILEHREKIRDKWNGFIRWNGITKQFEFFSRKEGAGNEQDL